MFNFHKDHRKLVQTAIAVFVILSFIIAVVPASQLQEVKPLPSDRRLTNTASAGLKIYVKENCMACHTQQVRNIEMDKVWGDRPSIPSDYYYSKKRLDFWRQSPSLLGSERTGPDLTNAGKRQPSQDWHLLHLYNPRIVIKESVMPSYPWLFEEKYSDEITSMDLTLPVPKEYFNKIGRQIVAKKEALQLVAYIQSLKQAPMPGPSTDFIPSLSKTEDIDQSIEDNTGISKSNPKKNNGKKLYTQVCAACHQPNGEGLPGAFPALAGSSIVNDEDYGQLVRIILEGYDARSEYGVMPGFADQLKDSQIAAIANHERSSWGNKAGAITEEDVKEIREYLIKLNQ